jgi:CRISPR-associated protein Csm5
MRDFLKNYTMRLQLLAPVFIGCGRELTKKEWILSENNSAIIPETHKLYEYAVRKGLKEEFEYFILKDINTDLKGFFDKYSHKISTPDLAPFSYSLTMGRAYQSGKKDEKPAGIQQFIKDAEGLPYIPGSSVKGAIRTVLLAQEIKKGGFDRFAQEIKRVLEEYKKGFINTKEAKKALGKIAKDMEKQAFFKLKYSDKNDVVNDIFRGLRIADSAPLSSENLMLCQKIDASTTKGKANAINTLRECLKPGTEAIFSVSIDTDMFNYYSIGDIIEAVKNFHEIYCSCFLKKFPYFKDPHTNETRLYLGGGAGYATKTIVYALLGENAVKEVNTILDIAIGEKKREKVPKDDTVSPRMAKFAYFNGKPYEMGACKMEFSG